jgi:hypothetical protein
MKVKEQSEHCKNCGAPESITYKCQYCGSYICIDCEINMTYNDKHGYYYCEKCHSTVYPSPPLSSYTPLQIKEFKIKHNQI